jgi:hypothetical protein
MTYQATGHFVPSKGPWRTFFREHLKSPFGAVPAPGEAGGEANTSAPPSGTATPVPLSETITPQNEPAAAGALGDSVAPSIGGRAAAL